MPSSRATRAIYPYKPYRDIGDPGCEKRIYCWVIASTEPTLNRERYGSGDICHECVSAVLLMPDGQQDDDR